MVSWLAHRYANPKVRGAVLSVIFKTINNILLSEVKLVLDDFCS